MAQNPKLKEIKALCLDVDGVMTDGSILVISDGDILRTYDSKDCFGLRMAVMNGLELGIITGGCSESLSKRFEAIGAKSSNIYLGSRIKSVDFENFCARNGFKASEVAYVGDDLPDVSVLKACGFGVAPADAVAEAKEAADFVSPFGGGKGCIRNLVEMILKAQDKWVFSPSQYDKLY